MVRLQPLEARCGIADSNAATAVGGSSGENGDPKLTYGYVYTYLLGLALTTKILQGENGKIPVRLEE